MEGEVTFKMKQTKENKIAVLVDTDNVSYKHIKEILDEVEKFGRICMKRVYGDFSKPAALVWKSEVLKNGFKTIHQFSYTDGKNAIDIALVIDAIDILHNNEVDIFCIVSSDSDFTPLTQRLRESGKYVIGVGKHTTPEAFAASCDKFIYYDNASEVVQKEVMPRQDVADSKCEALSPKTSAEKCTSLSKKYGASTKVKCGVPKNILEMIVQSIRNLSDKDGWASIGKVGSLIKTKQPDFTSKNYGFSRLTTLLKSRNDKFQTQKRDKGVYVKLNK
jgi:uncharacterized protein (TIGR00288 family)